MFSLRVLVIVFPLLPRYPPDNTRPWAKKSLPWRTRYHICDDSDWLRLRHWMKGSSFSKQRLLFFQIIKTFQLNLSSVFVFFYLLNNTCSRFLRVFFIPSKISLLKIRRQNALTSLKRNSWENASHKTEDVQGKSKSRISHFVYPCITA